MKARPFTLHSARPAWLQAVRGVMFFAIGATTVSMSVGFAAGGLVLRRNLHRPHDGDGAGVAVISEADLRTVCDGRVDRACAQTASDRAGVDIAYLPIQGRLEERVGARGDYRADQTAEALTLYSDVDVRTHDAGVTVYRTIDVGGAEITLWQLSATDAGLQVHWASWRHGGRKYELTGDFGEDPVAYVRSALADLRYATPVRGVVTGTTARPAGAA